MKGTRSVISFSLYINIKMFHNSLNIKQASLPLSCDWYFFWQKNISVTIPLEMKWATSRENVSSKIFDQVRFKPAWSATEPGQNLESLDIASVYIILSNQRTTKVLIRLCGCAGWSAPLLFAYGIRHVFAWPGPNIGEHSPNRTVSERIVKIELAKEL